MRAFVFCSLLAAALGVGLVGCSTAPDPWAGKASPKVLVTFPPLYSFAKAVAGDHGSVACLCTLTGPHHYDHTFQDTMTLRGADVFFANGLKLDDKFADKMAESAGAKDRVVKLGDKLDEKLLLEGECHHGPGHVGEHKHETDPHVWLGIPQAIAVVGHIRDELKKKDPAHAADYDRNAAAYTEQLTKLHEEGKAMFKDKKNKNIITLHESLGYLADSYGLVVVKTIQTSPGDEPTPARLKELVEACAEHKVRVIAVEPQYPKETAATALLRELKNRKLDAVLVEVDPLETAKPGELSAEWYARKTRENLHRLAANLQ